MSENVEQNTSIYENLAESFGEDNVKLLDNGSYKAFNPLTGNTMYFPADLSGDTSMLSYFPGAGGAWVDAVSLNAVAESATPPNCIITISGSCDDGSNIPIGGGTYGYNTMEEATKIAEASGINVSSVTLGTFSASGGPGFYRLEEYLENHPGVGASMIIADGYNLDNDTYLTNIDSLVEENVPIVVVGQNSDRTNSIASRLNQHGFNTYKLNTDRTDHAFINSDMINNGFLTYALGLQEDLNGDTLETCNYSLFSINSETGEFEEVDINEIDNLSNVYCTKFPLKLTLDDRKAYLNGETGTLASNLCEVATDMSGLNQIIGGYCPTDLQGTTSTASIPANLNNCENGFMAISSGILGNLSKETELITNIAQCIYDMDNDLSNRAYSLSDGTELLGGVSSLDNLLTYYNNNPLSFDLKISNFMFDPSSHKEGTTGSVNKSELTELLKETSPLRQNLTNEKNNAKSINSSIDTFKGAMSSGLLKGEIWDSVSTKLDTYKGLMDKRSTYAQKLDDAIVSALNLIVDYMGDYDSLDDGELETQRALEKSLMASIADAITKINATKLEEISYTVGKYTYSYYVRVYVYDAATRAEAARNLVIWEEDLVETRALIAALEGLWEKVAEAEQIINDALSEMYADYGVEASNVVVGTSSTYEPPVNTNFEPIKILPKTYESTERKTPWYKVTESAFNKNKKLQEKYGTYNDYLNGVLKKNNDAYNPDILKEISSKDDAEKSTHKRDTASSTGTVKVSEEEFNRSAAMKKEYGTYDNYKKGIKPDKTDTQGAPSQSAPAESTPAPTESETTPAESTPSQSAPSQSAPSQSAPSQSAPSQSAPSQSAPSQSAPNQSAPNQSTPNQSTPNQSAPSQSTPTPAESTPTPAETTPAESTPTPTESETTPAESTPTPAETTPTESTPTPVETKPTPVEQKPVTTERKPVVNYGNKTSVNNNKPIANNNSPKVETPVTEQPIVETPIVEEPVIETPVIEEPIIETPIIEEPVIETPIIEEPVIETPVIDTPIVEQPKVSGQSNNMLKNTAIIAGAGAVIGGAAFGAHKYLKSKEDGDDYNDYGYESDDDDDEDNNKENY